MQGAMTHPDEDDERRPDEGAEGESGAKDSPPPKPDSDDDSPLGDTDQHSGADA
jgi:hypothetical protein